MRLLPGSLYGRMVLVLAASLLLSQGANLRTEHVSPVFVHGSQIMGNVQFFAHFDSRIASR